MGWLRASGCSSLSMADRTMSIMSIQFILCPRWVHVGLHSEMKVSPFVSIYVVYRMICRLRNSGFAGFGKLHHFAEWSCKHFIPMALKLYKLYEPVKKRWCWKLPCKNPIILSTFGSERHQRDHSKPHKVRWFAERIAGTPSKMMHIAEIKWVTTVFPMAFHIIFAFEPDIQSICVGAKSDGRDITTASHGIRSLFSSFCPKCHVWFVLLSITVKLFNCFCMSARHGMSSSTGSFAQERLWLPSQGLQDGCKSFAANPR